MTTTSPSVVGRELELREISAFLDEVGSKPAALVLQGSPGIGKTTLWLAGVGEARDRGHRVLVTRAAESDARMSYAGLGDLLDGLPDEAFHELPLPLRRSLDRALLRGDEAGGSPDPRAVSLAVGQVLRTLASGGAVVLAIDDVQWLDRPTARVLSFVLRRLTDERIGVLESLRLAAGAPDDPIETDPRLGDGRAVELLLAVESHDHGVDHDLERAIEICTGVGGRAAAGSSRVDGRSTDEAAALWRSWFLQAPYLRDRLALDGLIVETFETATTWDRLGELHAAVLRATQLAIVEACGRGFVTWRLNDVYPDGVAAYYTVVAVGAPGREIAQWTAIKDAASEVLLATGGTITHHHAVGKTHRPWFERERGGVGLAGLRGIKAALDPSGIMNPGTLLA